MEAAAVPAVDVAERVPSAVVAARDVTRRYGEGDTAVDALRGVGLDVEQGKLVPEQRVVVVGLGDTAMETAIALCRQPNVTVTVLSRGTDFRRGKSRNIEEVRRMRDAGRLDLRFENEVMRIDRGRVTVRGPRGESTLTADVVFVMIGSILPWGFLESVAVRRGSVTSA